jgi:ATP-dependent DNA helicase RecG
MQETNLNILLSELCNQPQEQQWLEFKMGKGSITNDEIGEYISAMSNGAAIANQVFGYLVWGVEDGTQAIKGTNFSFANAKNGNQDLELWLRNLISPKINFEIFEFKADDKPIVLMRIPAATAEPTQFKKMPFIRIGSNKTDLRNHPNFMRMIYNSQEDWSAKTISAANINHLDPTALKVAKEKFKGKSIKTSFYQEIDNWDDATFLDKAKITVDGKITNTAILLLGKEESTHLLSPAIAEITWKLDTEEKAYEHFSVPFLLTTTKVMQNIRNVNYKFFPDSELNSITVPKYDTRTILEALHNCIAHQDYSFNSRIIVTEKIEKLIFSNAGSFFEGNPEDYSDGDKTPQRYRNPWLAHAMVNLGMIDSLGYGIHTMYIGQRSRYFPLPDYLQSDGSQVVLQIYGHSIDENYSKLLMERKDLPLSQVVLLDRLQKKLAINEAAATMLKKAGLIEGRKPNYFVTASVAQVTGKMDEYIKNRSFDDRYFKDMILEFIHKNGQATKEEIDALLLDKLSTVLDELQRKNKIKNMIYTLSKKDKLIVNQGTNRYSVWKLTPSA